MTDDLESLRRQFEELHASVAEEKAQAILAERERCAKIVERCGIRGVVFSPDGHTMCLTKDVREQIAAAIRFVASDEQQT